MRGRVELIAASWTAGIGWPATTADFVLGWLIGVVADDFGWRRRSASACRSQAAAMSVDRAPMLRFAAQLARLVRLRRSRAARADCFGGVESVSAVESRPQCRLSGGSGGGSSSSGGVAIRRLDVRHNGRHGDRPGRDRRRSARGSVGRCRLPPPSPTTIRTVIARQANTRWTSSDSTAHFCSGRLGPNGSHEHDEGDAQRQAAHTKQQVGQRHGRETSARTHVQAADVAMAVEPFGVIVRVSDRAAVPSPAMRTVMPSSEMPACRQAARADATF